MPGRCLICYLFFLVGFMRNMKMSPVFVASAKHQDVIIFFEEIFDLALMAKILGRWPTHHLYMEYQNHLAKPGNFVFFDGIIVNGRTIGCLNPKIRQSSSEFPAGLSSPEMMFVLCCAYLSNNVTFFNKSPKQYPLRFFYNNGVIHQHHYLISPHLLPLRFVQSKRANGHTCGHITYGKAVPQEQQTCRQQQWFWLPPAPTPGLAPVVPVIRPAVYAPVALTPTHSLMYNSQTPSILRSTNSNAF